MPTCQNAILFSRFLPADLQRSVQDVIEAQVSHRSRHCSQKGPPTHQSPLESEHDHSMQHGCCVPGYPGTPQRSGSGVKAPTVLMGAHQLGAASRPISRCGEAEYRCEVLCEFFQAGHEAHMDAVLKVGPGSHHGNLLFLGWLPGNQLRRNQKDVLGETKLPTIG